MQYREDCFANNGKFCVALNEKRCHKCKFYRTDLKMEDIDKDIKLYLLSSRNTKSPGGRK